MPKFVIERQYLVPMYQHIAIEAENLEEACTKAVSDDIDWDTQEMDCDSARATTITEAKVIPEGYDLDHFQPAACAAAIASMYSTPLTFNRAGTPPKSRPPHIDAYRALFTVPARDRTTVALFPAQRQAFHEAQHWLVGAEQI
jgi:hypothetical protein